MEKVLKFFDFDKQPGKVRDDNTFISKEKPLITIITPYYNASEYINQTANSIFNQTFPYWEWIIVNDGSTQANAKDVLDKLMKEDSRVKVYNKENEGVCKARDFAISKANTDLIFILDSDDLIENTVLECSYWTLKTNPGASWVYCNSVGFDDINYLWNKRFNSEIEKKENLLTVSALIKKEIIEQVGGYSFAGDNVHEDWHLWLRILAKGYYPVKMNYYGFWYRRKKTDSRMNSINSDKQKAKIAKKAINRQAQRVTKFIKAIQYPITSDYNYDSNPVVFDFDEKYMKRHKDKKRLLFIFPWFVVGGVDKFQLDLIKNLNKDEYDITIVTTENSSNEWRQKAEGYANEFFDLTSFLNKEYWASFLHYLIKSRGVDLVFVQNSLYAYHVLPWLKSMFPEIPFIDYVHVHEMKWRNGGYAKDSVNVSGIVDQTFTCTKFVKDIMINDLDRNIDNVDVAYIGVDEDFFNPDKVDVDKIENLSLFENKKVLLFICRIVEEKRPLLMARIFKELNKTRDDTVLLVVGDGPMLDWMKKEVQDNGLSEKVFFYGSKDDTRPYYKIADVTMIPSISEGLTITTYESLAMGTPVITADVGGQKELVDDTVGKVIKAYQHPEKDRMNFDYSKEEIGEYVDAIVEILDNPNYEKLSQACRRKILDKYTVKLMAKQLDAVFKDLINNGTRVNKNIDVQLASNYLVLFNELDRRNYEFPEDFIGMNKKNKPPKEELTLKEKLWSNPLYRGNIRMLQKLGIIKFLKKHDVDKKLKKIYKKINN